MVQRKAGVLSGGSPIDQIYRAVRPAVFALDPELGHRLAIAALALVGGQGPAADSHDPALASEVAGIRFANPLGMAAGFDKHGEAFDPLFALGFGAVEVGTITPLPQPGNPRPRLFRLPEDRAVINRFGFNSHGAAVARTRLERRARHGGVLGINIGANKDSPDRIADYGRMAAIMAAHADYLAVNISSPNTPGLRALQSGEALGELLSAVQEGMGAQARPIFLKVAPDLTPAEIDAIARLAIDRRLGALVVGNTTIERPASLRSAAAAEAGGLSGEPLKSLALERLGDFRKATGGAVPLVGVGGIASAADAWARIRAGASLVQIYSALVYEGPGLPRGILRGLTQLMRRDGFSSLAQAVGAAG